MIPAHAPLRRLAKTWRVGRATPIPEIPDVARTTAAAGGQTPPPALTAVMLAPTLRRRGHAMPATNGVGFHCTGAPRARDSGAQHRASRPPRETRPCSARHRVNRARIVE